MDPTIFDITIDTLIMDIKKQLLCAHDLRVLSSREGLPTYQFERRIRILKAMLVAASKES